MSKKTKISIIVATSFVLVGIILFASVMTVLGWDFKKLETVEFETNTYEINDAFRNISINAGTNDVMILPSENQECKVVCYTEKGVEHAVEAKHGTLTINTYDNRKWYEYISVISFSSSKITVYIPAGEYDSLFVKNSTGDIEISDKFNFKNIDVDVNTGDIICRAAVLESMKIVTSTGDVELDGANAQNIDVSTSTGDVTLTGVTSGGSILIKCSTGDVKLSNCDAAKISVETDTGDITLNNSVAVDIILIDCDTGDVRINACDAAEINIETDTGDVVGTILSEKIFIASTDTGDIRVPESMTGGRCKITTDTGDIEFKIVK